MDEEQFWNSTPKKLTALFSVYKIANGIESNNETEYIDNILL